MLLPLTCWNEENDRKKIWKTDSKRLDPADVYNLVLTPQDAAARDYQPEYNEKQQHANTNQN